MVEARIVRCYSSKESSLQGMPSQQSRLFLAFAAQYVEARKSTALTVQKSKMQSWENFAHKLDSDYRQANKLFWQYGVFAAKELILLGPSKTKMVSYSAMRKTSLGRWKEYFKDLLSTVTITPPNTRGTLAGEKHHQCSWTLPCCQNTAGCDENRPEILKSLNQVHWRTRVCQVAWCSARALKDWQTAMIIPIHERETGVNAPNTGTFLSLAFQEKYRPSALKKDAAKWLNQNWMIPGAVFVPTVALQNKLSFSRKFQEILAVRQRREHMFCRPRENIRPGYSEKLWGVLRKYGVDDHLLLTFRSLDSYSEVCICVGGVRSQPFTVAVGLLQGRVLSPLQFIVYISGFQPGAFDILLGSRELIKIFIILYLTFHIWNHFLA